MKKMGMFLLGVISGGVIGASLVFLFTPDSGENMRHQMLEYSNTVRDDIRQAAQTKRMEMEQELAKLRQKPAA